MPVPEGDNLSRAIATYRAGASVPAIAADLGIGASTLYGRLRAAGVAMRKPTGRPPHPPEIRERVLELSREGKTYDEITLATGVSGSCVYSIRRAAGMTRRYGRDAS